MRNIKAELVKETNVFGVKLVNLTPHDITIFPKLGGDTPIAKVRARCNFHLDGNEEEPGEIAKVRTNEVVIGNINGIPVTQTRFEEIEDIPDMGEDVVFIVSALVLSANEASPEPRTDLIAPNTSPSSAVRDKHGNIIGVRGFTIR